ncbi:Pyruvate, phosphate dikinase [Candidatus Hydrogenisulfobacillus filiaventi]|uniref:Pyruvate, phosphate dikinase n=1 Tax=Candidatus Hydrogenisulfobacillus filiaventi TaxID=2707344 RepID=A0A6F8ZJI1_9FIRM|nr:Pyruvate, phosphate dikinase [Candidatus Hydrogenisulfobacillus filiaventi]
MSGERYVFDFAEGSAADRARLGGKGAGLAEMTRLGLPVPPGFTITTAACIRYQQTGDFPLGLLDQVWAALERLEARLGRRLGDARDPLLVSVRSGAPVSMPGMMDTVLNLGLNPAAVEGLARVTGDRRFAFDSYRRFIQMFGNVVLHIEHDRFEQLLAARRLEAGAATDAAIPAPQLEALVADYLALVAERTGKAFPQDPFQQLVMAIRAVFDSWNNPRAVVYRKLRRIPDDLGTAVNVQAMVFGNRGPTSATGVLFTRNPNTGEPGLYGEYLTNAQGEDVVAGLRTPAPIGELAQELPAAYADLERAASALEAHYRDMQDVEFTIEEGRLWVLQTRTGKRTARAAVRIAVDLAREGVIDRAEAVRRQDPEQLRTLLYRQLDPAASLTVLATGLPASPGAAGGAVVFDADEAERRGNAGERVLLVRPETTPDDIHGIVAAQGVLTSHGGMTSHAAIVARGMGKPAVTGCEAVVIDLEARQFTVAGRPELGAFREGTFLTIDGASGRVILGEVPTVEPDLAPEFLTLLEWADGMKRLTVEANADTPEDAQKAREFGATGIGLCRTEHMFMGQDRLPVMQEMILAESPEERTAALERLLPMQEEDFYGILAAMDGYPVTIRLLDPPLHEFLPDAQETERELAQALARGDEPAVARLEAVLRRTRALAEFNPMLGFRGVRLGVVYPEIYAMQARAIFQAQARLLAEGRHPVVEVMIPLVAVPAELERLAGVVAETCRAVEAEHNRSLPYRLGTMIEVPRAALVADRLAEYATFFSFGTNDLTQTTFGFSRDDAEGKFLPAYIAEHILPDNPFITLDQEGVGQLITLAVARGRSRRPDLKVGICGEHGGDPASIAFCHRSGLDYVSCSPYRVPIARLAAAQAALAG